MLNSTDAGTRPAAPPRRRSFLLRSLATVAVGGSLLVLGTEACAPPPPWPQLVATRQAVDRTLAKIRAIDPQRAKVVEQQVTLAEAATAARQTALPWARGRFPVEERWNVAVATAHSIWRDLDRAKRVEKEGWHVTQVAMAADLARARAEAKDPGLGRRVGIALTRAEVLVATAERLGAQGQYREAAVAAAQAKGLTAVVHEKWLDLHKRFNDPQLRALWRRWVDETLAEAARTGAPAIIVDKLARRLDVYVGRTHRGTFVAELGANGLRPKRHSGDQATPEGRYRITEVRGIGRTKFYKALMIDYPNSRDLERFRGERRAGTVPAGVGPGSLIEVHGDGGQGKDWTDGCVALTNRDMDEVFALAGRVGAQVTIVGTLD